MGRKVDVMKTVLNERVKKLILSKIFIAEYREVMRLVLEDYSKDEIAYKTGYSVRQVERIRGRCWQEVCIYLAEDIIKINDGELKNDTTRKNIKLHKKTRKHNYS